MFLKSENMGSKKDDYKDHFNLKFNRRRNTFFSQIILLDKLSAKN